MKTIQEIAAKSKRKHLQPETSQCGALCVAVLPTRLYDVISASGHIVYDEGTKRFIFSK